MTRKHQPPRSSPEFSTSSPAVAAGNKPRRGILREETEDDDDYSDASASQSLYDEYEPSEKEEDNDSLSNALADRSSSQQATKHVPEGNKIHGQSPSVSASNSPNPDKSVNQNASYIKIAPLPIFRGTPNECPITHLSRFNKVCRANGASSIDMLMRIFPVTLEEEAALWYDLNIEPYPCLSWDEMKSSFLQAYYKIELVEGLRSELMRINQGEKESVRSYFLRLQWILERWVEHGLSDALLKGIFIDGLRAEYHEWILLQKPNTLNDALRLAFSFEQLRSIRNTKQMVPTCGFCDGLHEERNCEVREEMKVLWRQIKKKQGSVTGNSKEAKDFVRSISMGATSVHGKVEADEGDKDGESMEGNMKKNQCQCNKHQCWKKKILRNSSLLSRTSYPD